jgi:hypothetical protein
MGCIRRLEQVAATGPRGIRGPGGTTPKLHTAQTTPQTVVGKHGDNTQLNQIELAIQLS